MSLNLFQELIKTNDIVKQIKTDQFIGMQERDNLLVLNPGINF